MKSFFVIFLLVTVHISAFNQLKVFPASDLFNDQSGHIRSTINKTESNIEGSPYVFEGFMPGVVFPKNSGKAFQVDLNINAYSSLFEFRFEDRIYEMPNHSFDSVLIGRSTFVPVSVFKNDNLSIYSMEVLARDGKGNLLVKEYVIRLLEPTMAKAYHQATPARYMPYPSNYYMYDFDGKELVPLRSYRTLYKKPGYPADELKDFIRENRIKKRNIRDLQKLFRFLYPA